MVEHNWLYLFIVFDLGFTAHQDYFTHFEPSQLLGGAKTGYPHEKPHDPQAEHKWPELGSSPQRWRAILSAKD